MADIISFDYPTSLAPLSHKYLNWDEKGADKKSVDKLKRFLKAKLRKSFGNRCYFCKEDVQECTSNYDIEHILPKSQDEYVNFTFNPKNLALSCERCNRLKGKTDVLLESERNPNNILLFDNYPFISDNFEIIHPYLDNYDEHILIIGIFYLVKKNSKKGINTIKYYHLARLSLAESKIKRIKKIKNESIRHILNNESITNEITIHSLLNNSLNGDNLPGTNSYDVTTLIDNYLNPLDTTNATQTRVNKLKNINKYNSKDFIEFKKLIIEMNKKFLNWYDDPNWYNDIRNINAFKQSSCFNRSTDINLVIENIATVLNGLKGLYGTTKLREKLEYITIKDVYELISTFRSYFNDRSYNSNGQMELLMPILYALECSKFYNSTDFTNNICNKLAFDTKIIEGIKKIFKKLHKKQLI